jgi:protein-disulfide isomerase
MDKRFLVILGAIVVIFIGIFAFNQGSNDKNSKGGGGGNQATNHVTGQGKAGVTLIEYGDYQCPVCGSFEPVVKQVREKYAAEIFFQFRNLPIVAVHKNAFAAARAAEAAGMQGKYWQMHDKLYENQDLNGKTGWVATDNPISYFTTFAQQIGLNVTKFKSDYASSQVNDAINADLAAFAKTGQQQATPTFFLDGKVLTNNDLIDSQTGPSLDKFSKIIDAEIAQKTSSNKQ